MKRTILLLSVLLICMTGCREASAQQVPFDDMDRMAQRAADLVNAQEKVAAEKTQKAADQKDLLAWCAQEEDGYIAYSEASGSQLATDELRKQWAKEGFGGTYCTREGFEP
jgi:hypothetical protein